MYFSLFICGWGGAERERKGKRRIEMSPLMTNKCSFTRNKLFSPLAAAKGANNSLQAGKRTQIESSNAELYFGSFAGFFFSITLGSKVAFRILSRQSFKWLRAHCVCWCENICGLAIMPFTDRSKFFSAILYCTTNRCSASDALIAESICVKVTSSNNLQFSACSQVIAVISGWVLQITQ